MPDTLLQWKCDKT